MATDLTSLTTQYPPTSRVQLADGRTVTVLRFYRCFWNGKARLEFLPAYTESRDTCPATCITGPAVPVPDSPRSTDMESL